MITKKNRIFTTFQELPLGIPLNSERSEESKALIIKSFRFFGASLGNFTKLSLGSLMLRITEIDKFQKKRFSLLKSGEEPKNSSLLIVKKF